MQPHTKRERPLGRRVFGRDPRRYDQSRLDYPPRVLRILRERCHVGAETIALEIGPGTGKGSRALLGLGVASLTAVEANPRLARYLREHLGPRACRVDVRVAGFEEARLPSARFDLVAAATSFHWLDERRALRKVARVLKPGGWWAAWWNHHGDPFRPSAFQRAIQDPVYGESEEEWRDWLERRRRASREERRRRIALLRGSGRFDRISFEEIRWHVRLPAVHVQRLWSTFSEVATLPPRRRRAFLRRLGQVVRNELGGAARISMVTPIYTARRT